MTKKRTDAAYKTCPLCEKRRCLAVNAGCRYCRWQAAHGKEARHAKRNQPCKKCHRPLGGGGVCVYCKHGVELDWTAVATIYSYRNPDDPITPQTAKACAERAVRRLRAAIDRDTDEGRVLLGCLAALAA